MNAILKEEPPDFGNTVPGIPPGLERVVRHCLEKDPAERFQSARDLAFDLAALSLISGSSAASHPALLAPSARRTRPFLVALASVGILSAVFLAGRHAATVPPPPVFKQLTFRPGMIQSARFSPDGHTVVYGAAWDGGPIQLYQTRMERPDTSPLPLPEGDVLSISSSGEMALSLGRRFGEGAVSTGTLARVPLTGGAPRAVMEDVQEADWDPSGVDLAVVRSVGTSSRLEYPMGRVLYETAGWISHARISPRGDLVAFLDHPVYGDDRGSVAVVDRAGNKKTLSADWSTEEGLAWAPSGDEVWFTAAKVGSASALHAVSLSGRGRLVARAPGRLFVHDISRAGRVLLTRESFRAGIRVLPPGGTRERELSAFDASFAKDLSADGTNLLFDEEGEGGGSETYVIYLRRTDGSPAVRLGEGAAMSLSPDGRSVLGLRLTPPPHLFVLPVGAGATRAIERATIAEYQRAMWFPDGRRVLFAGSEKGHAARLYVQELDGTQPRPITPEGVGLFFGNPVSPDGELVATLGLDQQAALYPVKGGSPRAVRSLEAGEQPIRWSTDGRSLYAYRRGDLPARIYRVELASGRRTLWKEVMPADPAGIYDIDPVLVSPDGAAYAYTYARVLSELYLVDGLR